MTSARTYLFVPADRPERYAKALAAGADAVVIDLEDAVLPAAKVAAREALAAFLRNGTDNSDRIVVRINDAGAPWHADDVTMAHDCGVKALMLPKAERPRTLVQLQDACPRARLLPLVESARGVLACEELAAVPGVQRLVFGTVDYALDMSLEGELATTLGLDYAAAKLALASRAAGIESPVAGVTVAIDDEALLLAELARARAHGFGAKLCIHPKQVAAIHAALAPTADELAWARRVVDAADTASGAVQVDGRMIDRPVIERARRLLARTN